MAIVSHNVMFIVLESYYGTVAVQVLLNQLQPASLISSQPQESPVSKHQFANHQ